MDSVLVIAGQKEEALKKKVDGIVEQIVVKMSLDNSESMCQRNPSISKQYEQGSPKWIIIKWLKTEDIKSEESHVSVLHMEYSE